MKFNEILNEKLEDIPIKEILEHSTNFGSFLEILKSGYLKGRQYNTNTSNEWNKDSPTKKMEIATTRLTSKMSKENLSTSTGKISFFIYKNRLQGSTFLRNGKIKSIAEIPLNSKNYAVKAFMSVIKKYNYKDIKIKSLDVKLANDFINDLIKKSINFNEEEYSVAYEKKLTIEIVRSFNKIYGINIKDREDLLFDIFEDIYGYITSVNKYLAPQSKESEERIVLGDNETKLPLNKQIMNIKFSKDIIDEVKQYDKDLKLDHNKVLKLLQKYEDLIQNTPEKTEVFEYFKKE